MVSSIPTARHNWPLSQLYMAFEQLIMRHALWVPPNELAPFNTSLLTIRANDSGAFARALTHPDYFTVNNPDPQSPSSWICPEITRMIALSVARSIKIIGDTINTEFITLLQAHKWGASTIRWFPPALLNNIGQQDHADESNEMERIQNARQAYSTYINLQDSQQRYDFLIQQCGKAQFTGIVVIFLTFWESSYGANTYQPQVNRNAHIPFFYRFLEHLNTLLQVSGASQQ
uniref:Mediator of RNA polymerase II transcription subunit 23 n=1 Tax=Steinernema glaseri TaxID=37863 RepID=A0A1I8A6P7_9BILA